MLKKILNKSRRTIQRYLKGYRKLGVSFILHKNINSKPKNKISDKIKLKVQKLIKNKYFDLNLAHLK